MPFDNTPEGRLTLADLSWRLRSPETWPAGFVWNYGNCETCAMGLAWRLSGGSSKRPFRAMTLDTILRLTMATLADATDFQQMKRIFLELHIKTDRHDYTISPHNVADAIDEYLADRRASVEMALS